MVLYDMKFNDEIKKYFLAKVEADLSLIQKDIEAIPFKDADKKWKDQQRAILNERLNFLMGAKQSLIG